MIRPSGVDEEIVLGGDCGEAEAVPIASLERDCATARQVSSFGLGVIVLDEMKIEKWLLNAKITFFPKYFKIPFQEILLQPLGG